MHWCKEQISELYEQPFFNLINQAQSVHLQHFPEAKVQLSTLINIKDGGCPEDCAYCPQAQRYHTGVVPKKLMDVESVKAQAKAAKKIGATRFCMGAAWRELKDRDVPTIKKMIHEIKALGMESCVTLGMLTQTQAHELKDAGLDYYNHNLDTSPEYYNNIITTRTYDDRLNTLDHVRTAGINVCCGGILGLGETREDRIGMLATLANMSPQPKSVPINKLIPIPGTPLEHNAPFDTFEFVRTIAVARILMPNSYVRLSAGRTTMSDEMHALCFLAGANSMHYGDKLLMTSNPSVEKDRDLLKRLGIEVESSLDKNINN